MSATPAPPGLTVFLCLCLMVVYMAQGLMITASKNASGGYDYDKNASVMLSEMCKFGMSAALLAWQAARRGPGDKPLTAPLDVQALRFAVPGALYALHNNVIFVALELLSPVTYQLFNNLKIVTTALVFRVFLRRQLRLHQWMAVVLLPLGMCVTQLGSDGGGDERVLRGFLWMVVLSSCSAFAGVYNEFLLKNGGGSSSLHWKNMQLYAFGTLACMASYLCFGEDDAPGDASLPRGLLAGFGPMAWGVVLLNGVLGQIISAIFFYADNVVKVYAASGAVLVTPFASRALFGTELGAPLFVGVGVALVSLFLYFLPPGRLGATDVELTAALCGGAAGVSKDIDRDPAEGDEEATMSKDLIRRVPNVQ